MLFYICDENGIKKNKVVYIIKLRSIFLLLNFDLIITALISITADNISSNTIYISFAISVKNKYKI